MHLGGKEVHCAPVSDEEVFVQWPYRARCQVAAWDEAAQEVSMALQKLHEKRQAAEECSATDHGKVIAWSESLAATGNAAGLDAGVGIHAVPTGESEGFGNLFMRAYICVPPGKKLARGLLANVKRRDQDVQKRLMDLWKQKCQVYRHIDAKAIPKRFPKNYRRHSYQSPCFKAECCVHGDNSRYALLPDAFQKNLHSLMAGGSKADASRKLQK